MENVSQGDAHGPGHSRVRRLGRQFDACRSQRVCGRACLRPVQHGRASTSAACNLNPQVCCDHRQSLDALHPGIPKASRDARESPSAPRAGNRQHPNVEGTVLGGESDRRWIVAGRQHNLTKIRLAHVHLQTSTGPHKQARPAHADHHEAARHRPRTVGVRIINAGDGSPTDRDGRAGEYRVGNANPGHAPYKEIFAVRAKSKAGLAKCSLTPVHSPARRFRCPIHPEEQVGRDQLNARNALELRPA